MTDSGWLRRKTALRVPRDQQQRAPAEEERVDSAAEAAEGGAREQEQEHANDPARGANGANEQGDDDDDDDALPFVRRWRHRVRFSLDEDISSGDEQSDGGGTNDQANDEEDGDGDNEDGDGDNEDGDGGGGALDRLLREDDSAEEADDAGVREELGLDADDRWDGLAARHPGVLNLQQFQGLFRRGYEIALHLADAHAAAGNDGEEDVVDLQDTQNDDGQEIDLTALSSDSEGEGFGRGGGHDDDDDDEVVIVGSNAGPLMPMPIRPAGVGASPRGGLSRKRRRTNDAAGDQAAANRPFDMQRAESTNVSLENNETIERFKAALKCSVCLEVIEDMTSTICGHVYCAKCIRLAIRVTHKCPLCQRPLRQTDIHGLFF